MLYLNICSDYNSNYMCDKIFHINTKEKRTTMENKFSKTLLSLSSGLIGVMLTIGYQHFFAPSQSFAFIIGDEKVEVTQSEYMELAEQNVSLQNELNDLQNKYDELNNINETNNKEIIDQQDQLEQLQLENSQLETNNLQFQNDIEILKEEKTQLTNEKKQLTNEKTQLQSELDNLENEISNLKNETTEYNQNYDNQNVSTDNNKTDIDTTVSIFTLETFQGLIYWWNKSDIDNSKTLNSDNFIDTYDNEYPSAKLASHYVNHTKDKNALTYLLDYNYSKCEGKIAWPKSDKNEEGSAWIEFYSGDELFYQTEPITASDRALSFEFSVEGVEKLTVVQKASRDAGIVDIIYPYFNLVQ